MRVGEARTCRHNSGEVHGSDCANTIVACLRSPRQAFQGGQRVRLPIQPHL